MSAEPQSDSDSSTKYWKRRRDGPHCEHEHPSLSPSPPRRRHRRGRVLAVGRQVIKKEFKPQTKKAPKRRVVLQRRQEHPSPSRRNRCRKRVVLKRRSPTRLQLTPAPPGRPPPSLSGPSDLLAVGSPGHFPGGFWFGINYQIEIEGPDVCGRYLYAKRELQRSGEIDCRPAIGGIGLDDCAEVSGPAVGGPVV